MADENKQIEMKKISALDELDSLGTDSYTVVSKNGSSYKFDLSKVDLTEVNRELNAHTQQLEQHTNKLVELENELDGSLKISSVDENTLKLEDGKLSVIGGGGTATGVSEEFVNNKIDEVKRLIDDKANETHKHEMSDVNGLLHDKQEVYQRRIDLTLREQTVVESINENYKDIKKLQADKVDKAPDMELISTAEKQKLAAIADGAEVNVQSDWNVTDEDSDAFIKNKPKLELYATQAYVDEKIAQAGTGGTVDLSGYVTEVELSSKGYLTQQSLDDYAKKSDIPTNHVTQTELAEVSGKVVALETSNTTLLGDVATLKTTVEGIDTTYATKTELGAKVNSTDLADVATSGDYDDLTNKPDLFDGNYNSLTNKPTIPTTVAQLTDSDTYAKVSNIPTKVSDLTNDSDYVTDAELTAKGYLTQHQSLDGYAKTSDIEAIYAKQEKLTEVSDKVAEISGKVATLETSNTTLTGNVTTLTGEVTTLKTTVEAIDTTYAKKQELTNGLDLKANSADLKTVATTGSYNDLVDTPTIPTKTSELKNDSNFLTTIPSEYITEAELTDKGYLTEHQSLADYATKANLTDGLNAKADKADLTQIETLLGDTVLTTTDKTVTGGIEELKTSINGLATVAKSGKYTDLIDTPTIPSVDGLVKEQTLQDGLSLKADKTELEPIKTLLGEETLTTTSQTVTGGVNELKEKTEYVGKNTRKFNPKYCFSCFWGETTDTSGGSWTASIEKMTKDVNACKEANVDGFILIIHIGYNATTNNFYIVEDLDALQNGIDLMKENHIQPKAIKLHAQKYSSSDITTFGEDNFKTTWKNFITQIGEKFADCGFEYLTVHNEVKYIYNNSTYTDFVLECFELARNMGYKTGITNAGFEEACHGTISEILDNADAIFVNHYQPITNKGSKIQKQLSVDAWEYSFCMNYIDHLYCKYDKPIIISESGVQDYWCALAQPSKYSWSETQETNGEAPYVYLYGAFEVLNSSPIAELWGWYGIDYPIVKNLIKYYMGGIYNE